MHGREAEYLVKTIIPQYSGSAALYLDSLKRDGEIPPNPTPSVLAIGNPAFNEALPAPLDMPPLPHAEEEAQQVLLLYGRTGPLTREKATVPEFLSRAPHADIIHIAAHAVINEDEPARSAILLAPSDGNSGGLEPHQIQQLKLHKTRLMVLSACETGGGLRIGSEGVAPLVRPTLATGVPGVVATLWDVDDATTKRLMVSFHAQYAKGHDAAIALRSAQLEAINGKTFVRDWAAFQVIGHASSPFASRPPDQGGNSIGIHASHSLQRSDGLRSQ
jgi:CHAT domain-containing protein